MSNDFEKPTKKRSQSFLDYFRCPSEFAPCLSLPSGPKSNEFFRFGSATCFGNVGTGQGNRSPRTVRLDATPQRESPMGGKPLKGFDPDEVVDNLRLERYVGRDEGERVLHTLYYLLRPVLPLAIRKRLQRAVFRKRLECAFPTWPVDCSVEQVFEEMMTLSLHASGRREIPFIWFWPDGNSCALMMTHDVEQQKGAEFCDALMDLDESFGIKAAFQLIPEGAYKDFDSLASQIRARGFELNIHDLDHDGRLYEHKKLFETRASRINEYGRQYGAQGFRSGSMHRNQDWFGLLDFSYDMSVPTVSHLEPQNGGCCTVTPYFVGNVLELPLTTIQDHGLFYILSSQSIDLWKQQIETIMAHHGLISFIVHPDYVSEDLHSDQYRRLLQHVSDLRATQPIWVALPGEINRWWRERSKLQLIPSGDSWKITGAGSDRARLAFASLRNGRVAYRIAEAPGSHTESMVSAAFPRAVASVHPG